MRSLVRHDLNAYEERRRLELHHRMITGYGGAAPFLIDAADFDGTDDMSKATLTGQAASKSGIFSVWFKADTAPGVGGLMMIMEGDDNVVSYNDFFQCYLANSAGNRYIAVITGEGSGPAVVLQLSTSFTANSWNTGTWYNILASWDGATGAANLYINDAVPTFESGSPACANLNVRYNLYDEWRVGEMNNFLNGAGVGNFDGGLAELYFAPGQYLDFSDANNRRKFITAAFKPVNLGAGGATPTGTQPLVYQSLADGGAAASFATNKGTGGNWTIGGTLTTYASSPSD